MDIMYISDPMCSWCYGFSPVITQIREKYSDQFNFKLLMGGLRPGTTEPLGEALQKEILHHWEAVNERTGRPFTFEGLTADMVYDTEPPSRAIVTARELTPGSEFELLQRIHHAFYVDNKDMNDVNTFLPLLEGLGVDETQFVQYFEHDAMKEKTNNDFVMKNIMQVPGFPYVMGVKEAKLYDIAYGYQSFEFMDETFQKLIEMLKEEEQASDA